MASLAGKWVLVEKENYGRFLQKSGAKPSKRIFDNLGKTRLRISTDLDSWTYGFKTNLVKDKHTYKHNQEYREVNSKGEETVSVFKIENPKKHIITKRNSSRGECVTEYELLSDNILVVSQTCRGVLSKRIFKRKEQ